MNQIVNELDSSQGPERLYVAQAKEQLAYRQNQPALRVALLQDAVHLRSQASLAQDSALQLARLSLAKSLEALGDLAAAEHELSQRVDAPPRAPAPARTRESLGLRVQRVNHQLDLVWFLLAHGRAAQAQDVLVQVLDQLPGRVTASWLLPVQKTREAEVWARLLSGQTTGLAASWRAYEAALNSVPGAAGRMLLFHEADRALVAQALHDDQLLAAAQGGIQAARARLPKTPPALCQTPAASTQADWHRLQHAARRRVLTELGACAPL